MTSPTPDREAARERVQSSICKEIMQIMETYRQQEAEGTVWTPGGLEHMGDVWRLLGRWDDELRALPPDAEPSGWREYESCTLGECPPGMFMFGGNCLGFKSEYKTESQARPGFWKSDAYVVESGEYFWGGAHDAVTREALIVTPLNALPPPPIRPEGEGGE